MIDFVTLYDSRGKILWISRTDSELPITVNDVIGQTPFDISQAEFRDNLTKAFAKTLIERTPQNATAKVDFGGIEKEYRVYFHPIHQEGVAVVASHAVPYQPIQLTARETEIAVLIASDFSTKQIAEKLIISTSTVETHRQSVSNKLGGCGVAGITRFCIRYGLILV